MGVYWLASGAEVGDGNDMHTVGAAVRSADRCHCERSHRTQHRRPHPAVTAPSAAPTLRPREQPCPPAALGAYGSSSAAGMTAIPSSSR